MDGPTVVIWLVIIYIIVKRVIKAKLLPPGPNGLPVFGNLLNIAWPCYRYQLSVHQVLSQWATRYSKVFSFSLGNQLVVVLNDVASAKEAFMGEDMNDRPAVSVFDKFTKGTGKLIRGSHLRDKIEGIFDEIMNE